MPAILMERLFRMKTREKAKSAYVELVARGQTPHKIIIAAEKAFFFFMRQTVAVRPPISHHTNHPNKINNICRVLPEK